MPTIKPVLQQIRLLQVTKSCCSNQRVAIHFGTKSAYVARFTGSRQSCVAACDNSRVWHDSSVILSNQKSVSTKVPATFICCKTGLNMGYKTCYIALQQCCKTICAFLLPVLLQLYSKMRYSLKQKQIIFLLRNGACTRPLKGAYYITHINNCCDRKPDTGNF